MVTARGRRRQQALFDHAGRPLVRDGKRVPKRRRRKPGRKPKGLRAGSPHKTRPELDPSFPVHVVLRVVDAIGNMRNRHMYKALREATFAVAKRELNYARDGAYRIVHLSIQRNHVHLLVEADHKTALSRGMQSFQISAAKHLNRAFSLKSLASGRHERGVFAKAMATRRRGTVFPDRFHQEIIKTRKQARHTLAYVLNNWRKHREDRYGLPSTWKVDPFSTGVLFEGWKERQHEDVYMPFRETYQPMVVYFAKTWLLRDGWRMYGLISFGEVPSAKQAKREPAR
jgi:REP element-mobilizing transposase RayT